MAKDLIRFDVNKEEFKRFLSLIELSGELQIKELILQIMPLSMIVLAVTQNKTVALKGELKGDFKVNATIGIDDLVLLKNSIDSFKSETIKISIQDNKLILTSTEDKIKISTVMRAPEYIQTALEDSKFLSFVKKASGNEFTLTSDIMKDVMKYTSTLAGKTLSLSGDKINLVLEVENNQNEIVAEFFLLESVNKFNVKLSNMFLSLLKTINESCKISVINGETPVYLKYSFNNTVFEYIIAPVSK